jgi:predicted 3-demethylubiquinone-9 3-methyltransferase (glyoxalase superfamily)
MHPGVFRAGEALHSVMAVGMFGLLLAIGAAAVIFARLHPARPAGEDRTGSDPGVMPMRALVVVVAALHFLGCQAPSLAVAGSATAVSTHMMFQDAAAERALALYESVFPGFRITEVERYGPGEEAPEGVFKLARVDFCGQRLMVYDSPSRHPFGFTPSMSLLVEFATPTELDAAFEDLAAGGEVLMPVADYGFSRRFGWCNDRFGVSWQLNLPHEAPAESAAAR